MTPDLSPNAKPCIKTLQKVAAGTRLACPKPQDVVSSNQNPRDRAAHGARQALTAHGAAPLEGARLPGDAAPHTRSRPGVARWVWDPSSAAVVRVQHPPAPRPAELEPQKTPGAGSALTRGQRMRLQEPLAQGRSLLFVPQISRDHLQLHQHPRPHPDPPSCREQS